MPATLPCPKMPKQPANSFCRSPSRSVHWAARKRTTAWATVSRTVCSCHRVASDRAVGGRRAWSVPGVADPAVGGVVADQPGPLGAGTGHDVEVVQVVAGGRHRRPVPAVGHQDDVAGADLGEHVDRALVGAVDPLVADGSVDAGQAESPGRPGPRSSRSPRARSRRPRAPRRACAGGRSSSCRPGVTTSHAMIESASRTPGTPKLRTSRMPARRRAARPAPRPPRRVGNGGRRAGVARVTAAASATRPHPAP